MPESSVPGRLIEVFLDEAHFDRHLGYTFPEEGTVTYTVDTGINAELNDDRNLARVRLTAAIRWAHNGERVDGPFDLHLVIGAWFDWAFPDRQDEDIYGWLEFNSTHLLWPYLRNYVTTLTALSGLPPLTIYTISAPRPNLGRVAGTEESTASAPPPESESAHG